MKRPKRKAIPKKIKIQVWRQQQAICPECKEFIIITPSGDNIQYDHRPAIIMRPVNAAGTDYEPPQNDPNHIEALHKACHLRRTVGRVVGASRTVTTKGSDIWLKSKFNRLEGRLKPRKKASIPQRKNPWPKRKFK